MKKYIIPIFICLASIVVNAQPLQHQWHFNAGGTGFDDARFITSDNNGNTYITGRFSGTVDFDPGAGLYGLGATGTSNKTDVFVQKLDAQGNFLWAKSFGGMTGQDDFVKDIVLDTNKNVYILGNYKGSIQFDPNDTVWDGGNANQHRPFVIKLDSLGNLIWSLGWKHTSNDAFFGKKIAIDGLGRIYLGGTFSGSVDFDPTSKSNQTYTSATAPTGQSTFLLRISAGGSVERVRVIGTGTTGSSFLYSLTFSKQQDIHVSGVYTGTVDFDNGSGTDLRTTGASAPYFTKLDSNFNFDWVITPGQSGYRRIAISDSGSIFIFGEYSFTTDLNPGPGSYNVTSNGSADCFLLKLDKSGNFQWAKTFGGSGLELTYSMELSPQENIVLTGQFSNTVDFDMGSNTYNLTSNGVEDGFILKVDSSGNFISAAQFGGSGSDRMYEAHFLSENEIFAAGYFSNTMDIDPSSAVQNVISNGDKDFFMVKLLSCSPSYASFSDTSCGSYTVPSGQATYTTDGIYNDTIASVMGCDSILTIQVKIVPALISSITQTISGLLASTNGIVNYQWMNCLNNQLVVGATDSIYMPSANGQYAVITNSVNCIDTSACFSINNVSIDEDELLRNLNIYPNPTTGLLNIESQSAILSITIYDLVGREVLSQNSQATSVDLALLPKGVYLVKVKLEQGEVVKRVVKE